MDRSTHDASCSRLDLANNGLFSFCQSCGTPLLEEDTASPSSHLDNIYQPLEAKTDIRLLTLEPGEFDDPIQCSLSLSKTSALPTPDYDAISYTWAGEDDTAERSGLISLNSREFSVTANCERVLRRVRRRWLQKAIWIDAICMNQDDVDERGHQVRLMPQIYSRARRVIIYVGEPTAREERLLDFLVDDYQAAGDGSKTASVQLKSSLMAFFKRRYFSRAWILQEVALARRAVLICGPYSLPWHKFHIAHLAKAGLLPSAQDEATLRTQLPSILNFRAPKVRDSSELLHLLDLARNSHATDPRDKVFSVFGLIACAENDGLSGDYTKTPREVFLQIAGWVAQRFGIPAMLARAINVAGEKGVTPADRPRESVWTPDWAPDWTETPRPDPDLIIADIYEASRLASPTARLPAEVAADENAIRFPVLKLGGFGEPLQLNASYRNAWELWEWRHVRFCQTDQRYADQYHFWMRDDAICLIPNPGDYQGFSFEQPGQVTVNFAGLFPTWKHRDPKGRVTTGSFSKYAIRGIDFGGGLVGLKYLGCVRYNGVEQEGQFEYIKLVSCDLRPLVP